MKKFFSIFAALLFAGSMMAVTLDPGTQTAITPTNTSAGDPISLTINGIQIDYTGALGAANPTATPPVPADFRVFAGKTLTLTATSNISKVVIAGKANKKDFTATVDKGTVTTGASYAEITEKAELTDPLIVVENINATSVTLTVGKQLRAYMIEVTLGEGGEPVEPGDEPTVLQAVKDSTTWDFSKITANTANALYNKEGIQLTDESTPSKNDEVIYADYSEDFMTIGEDFNKAAIAFKGEYPIRKNQYCQAGTLHFKADVAGTIVVKFSDTGSSASATAVKRYLVVNDEQTEYWTSRENNGETPYDAQLNVVSDKIAVPAGDVTITGSSAIVVHYVTFVPEKQDEPVLADPTNCAEAAEAALSVSANNELYNNGAEYTIEGYVTSIQTAFNAQYSNISFWMADTKEGGKVLEAYRAACETAADAPNVGDKVAVTGKLTKYGTTPEFAAGCTYTILERAEVIPAENLGEKTIAEFLELKNAKDTCILTGVVSNIKNEEYGNFDLVDETGSVYIYGLLTPEGESKKFADLNVAEKDTLTVLAIYNEYNGNPQAKNAIFVEVKKAAVEPGDTIKLVFDNGGVDNYYYANYGSTDIQLYNIPVVGGKLQGDGDYIQLEIYPADPNDISGEYSIEDEGLDDYYTYLMRISGNDTTEIEFVAGSITVSVQNPDKENSSADLTVQGELKTAEGDVYVINSTLNVYYNFTISEEEKYTLDEAEADFNYNFDTYQLMPTGSDIIVGVYAQTDEAVIAAMIVLPQGHTELVAGEYEVSVMPMYGTVMAGQYTAEGPQPSYALTSAGKLWYFVSGKVTVEGDGSIVIDALNSNGKAIKSTLNHLQGDGIDEVNAAIKATKTLKNGQLIIEKNGVRYNVNGQRIK